MIRHQFHAQVRIQHWREFYSLYEKLEELRRAKDLAPSQLWSPTVGQVNSALLDNRLRNHRSVRPAEQSVPE